jgi:hypothetical protein
LGLEPSSRVEGEVRLILVDMLTVGCKQTGKYLFS